MTDQMENDVEEWLRKRGVQFLKDVGVKKSQIVLDFGCGAGHYTIPAAKVVGKEGEVYAMDKDSGVMNELMRTAKSESLKNIEPMKTQGELKIELKDASVDVVLLYDVLHYMEQRRKILDEVYRVLKQGALLSVYPKHHKLDDPLWTFASIGLEDIIREIEAAGFHFEGKSFKELMHDDNYDKGHILNFRKSDKK
jgi:ubiquinone/menaquinone biosynthesis C-methylase UbiE